MSVLHGILLEENQRLAQLIELYSELLKKPGIEEKEKADLTQRIERATTSKTEVVRAIKAVEMDSDVFDELLESVKAAQAIQQGLKKPHKVTYVEERHDKIPSIKEQLEGGLKEVKELNSGKKSLSDFKVTRREITLQDVLDEQLKNPEFKKHFDEYSFLFGLGLKVLEARKELGISQKQLAKDLEISVNKLSKIERGDDVGINLRQTKRLMDFIGIVIEVEKGQPNPETIKVIEGAREMTSQKARFENSKEMFKALNDEK